MIEPGRAVVNNSGLILYTAGAIKEDRGEKPYILVDGGMSDNPRPALYGSEHKLFNISENKNEKETIFAVSGRNCESGVISGVRECAYGQGLKLIFIVRYFNEIRIWYVFNGQSITRIFSKKKKKKHCVIFVECSNHTATAGFFATAYKTLAGIKKNASEHRFGACAF